MNASQVVVNGSKSIVDDLEGLLGRLFRFRSGRVLFFGINRHVIYECFVLKNESICMSPVQGDEEKHGFLGLVDPNQDEHAVQRR